MQPNRSWRSGDAYWELWASLPSNRYVARCAGVVERSDRKLVHLCGGDWRFEHEGLPFLRREDALLYSSPAAATLVSGAE